MKEPAIEIIKTEEYLKSANVVSDYIRNLPLNHEQNDTLVKLLVDHGDLGRKDAFLQGFDMGMKLMKHSITNKNDEFTVKADESHFMGNMIVFDKIRESLESARKKITDPEILEEINRAIGKATQGYEEAWKYYEPTTEKDAQ